MDLGQVFICLELFVLASVAKQRQTIFIYLITLLPQLMGQIALEGMEFFAFHGYYDEEQKIGNKYGVDLHLKTDLHAAGTSDKLAETVNYEVLYRLVLAEMQLPARLLEHLAHRILDRIMNEFPQVRRGQVSISKFNPPLGGICHRARVTLSRKAASSSVK
jgi:dihydroneopterin aldolase